MGLKGNDRSNARMSEDDIKNKDDKQLKKANEVLLDLINRKSCYSN